MKTVLLMRHAKSAWGDPILDDFDRPLAARGRGAGPAMAAHMEALGLSPDHVICSAAVRAVETWTLMAPLFEGDIPMAVDEALFHASPGGLLVALRAAPGDAARLLLIAHSPGIETLAATLGGPQSDREAYARLCAKFPTEALAVIEFDIDEWRGLGETGGRLSVFVTPQDMN
jgi:phosphohistidine phosphatase